MPESASRMGIGNERAHLIKLKRNLGNFQGLNSETLGEGAHTSSYGFRETVPCGISSLQSPRSKTQKADRCEYTFDAQGANLWFQDSHKLLGG